MAITLNGTNGITSSGDLTLNNGLADGAQVTLASSGYSNWNLDNYSGRFRAYYNATEYFTVTNTGNVGIGTSSPSAKLNVVSSGTTGGQIQAANASYSTTLSAENGYSWLNSNGAYPLIFGTNGAERMRIDSSGNVGIGTTSPSTYGKLAIVQEGYNAAFIGTSTTLTNYISADIAYICAAPTVGSSASGKNIVFQTGSSGLGTERMRIDGSGNVGIGYTAPTQKLDVGGTVVADLGNAGQYHAVGGSGSTWYNAMVRNDGADVYWLSSDVQSTRTAAASAGWNSYRPFAWNLSNGVVSIDGTGAGVNIGGRRAYSCRAWVNFNGTGTVAIRASGNVSSITDNGTGDYTVNFTTAMPDANYSVSMSVQAPGRYPVTSLFTSGQTTPAAPSASAFRITIGDTAAASQDSAYVCLSVFR